MNDHNLDDLIIDNIEPKSSKTKSFLTVIALLIVVLIVAIILTKVLLKNQNEQEPSLKEDTTVLVAPELKLQEKPKVKKETQASLELSHIIEEEHNVPVPQPSTEPIQKPTVKPEVTKEETVETAPIEEKKPEPIKEEVKITQENVQELPTPKEVIAPKEAIVPKVVLLEVPKPQTVVKAVTPKKPTHLPTAKTSTNNQYYVQVGSFTSEPSKRFLSVIQSSGFNYKISKASTNGTKKLLIGPYPTRKDVDIALVRVRDRINKSAFVVQK